MVVTACPTAVVESPLDGVWRLLSAPERYPLWADADLVSTDPPGPVVDGQRIELRTRAWRRAWPVRIPVGAVDPL
jgi:hypothetical protein